MSHNLSDYQYSLPPELIASSPIDNRDESKLLIYSKSKDQIFEDNFFNIDKYIPKKTVFVLNNSKVFKARLVFDYNGKSIEIFFAEKISYNEFLVLVKPGKFFTPGSVVLLPEDVSLEVVNILEDGSRIVKILNTNFDLFSYLERNGDTPLPPYIKVDDPNIFNLRYQTVYAKSYGSVAAPTAGLHFTNSLITKLKAQGVEFLEVTLNVGLGTFKSVKASNISDHLMHSESFELTSDVAKKLNFFKNNDYAIIPVGTTSLRALQSSYDSISKSFVAKTASTNIFIYPGFNDWIIDGLVTNFHLPESTLIMLVAAYIGLDKTLDLYEFAVENKYRFFSFGDACLFLE